MAVQVVAKNSFTGEKLHFDTMRRAARHFQSSYSFVWNSINREGVCWVRNWKITRDRSAQAMRYVVNNRPVVRIDTQTGQRVHFISVRQAAKESYVSPSTITAYLRGRSRNPRIGYIWEYDVKE